jgi:hypothetical protein
MKHKLRFIINKNLKMQATWRQIGKNNFGLVEIKSRDIIWIKTETTLW